MNTENEPGKAPPPSEPQAPREFRFLVLALIGWAALFFGISFFSPEIPGIPWSVRMFLSSVVLVTLCFCFVIGWSRTNLHRSVYLLLGACAVALVFRTASPIIARAKTLNTVSQMAGANLFMNVGAVAQGMAGAHGIIAARNKQYAEIQDFLGEIFPENSPTLFMLSLAQLLLASGIGLWIGNGIDNPGHLIPIALVAGLADIWSVSAGATAVIIRSTTIYYFLLRFPLIFGSPGEYPFLIGLTDFLFFAVFYQAAVRFDLGKQKNIALLGLSFGIAVVAALFFSVGLPVLPFMAVLFVFGNWKNLKMKAEEIRQVVVFCLLAGAVAGIVTYLTRA